jgi:DNA-binding response OmpR family regulator
LKNEVAHILVVDDSPNILKFYCDLLLKKGYQVTACETGEDAIRSFIGNDFDLVLTDIMLPGMSGLNLLKLMKESKPYVDVIVISGNTSSFTTIKALRYGAYDYLVKPIDDEVILYNVVERTLEKKELQQQNQRLVADLSAKNKELQETLEMLKTANSLCGMISSTLEIGDILRMLVEKAVEQLKAHKGYLLLLDKTGRNFSMKFSVGISHVTAKEFKLTTDEGISGLVCTKNKPLRLDMLDSPDFDKQIKEEDLNGDLFTVPGILSFPLRVKDRVVGVVNICGRKDSKPFTDTEFEFLAILANHAAIALDTAGKVYLMKKSA